MATRSEIEAFLRQNDFSRQYQKIHLGHGLYTPGTDRSNSFKAATRDIDLKGKTYLDIGCMWGAMAFMAEGKGAHAMGCDRSELFVENARGIAEIKGSKAEFFKHDIIEGPTCVGFGPETTGKGGGPHFDVISMFNVIHHLRYPFLALHNALVRTGEYFIIEFPTLKGRWRKISVNSDSQTDTQAIGGPYLGIISKETGLYFTRWSMEIAVNWFGKWKLEMCRWSPYRTDRLLMTFRRV